MRELYGTLLLTMLTFGTLFVTFHYYLNSENESLCINVAIEPSSGFTIYNLSDGIIINFHSEIRNISSDLEYSSLNSTSIFFPIFQFGPNSTYRAVVLTNYTQFVVTITTWKTLKGNLTISAGEHYLNDTDLNGSIYFFIFMILSVITSFVIRRYGEH